MNMRTNPFPRTGALLAAIGATLILVSVGANGWAGDSAPRKHEAWSWSGALASGRALEINGINGPITAERSESGRVEVTADKSGRRDDPSGVKIEVTQDSNGITICAVYPGQNSACRPLEAAARHRNDSDVQVDFHVKVPAGVSFTANTVNGRVSALGLAGPVHAHTVNGACDIATSVSGDATTVNGSVSAVLGRVSASERLRFNTVNGSITLTLPDDLDAEVEGSTVNGGIRSDFPVTVNGGWGPQSLHGTLGHGGASLSASTVNGSIRLARSN